MALGVQWLVQHVLPVGVSTQQPAVFSTATERCNACEGATTIVPATPMAAKRTRMKIDFNTAE